MNDRSRPQAAPESFLGDTSMVSAQEAERARRDGVAEAHADFAKEQLREIRLLAYYRTMAELEKGRRQA